MKRVLLCRHGQDEDNIERLLNGHRDRPLTALGREQAAAVATRVAREYTVAGGNAVDVILCSPLQRAHDTARAIGAAVAVEPIVMPALIERDFGILSGKSLDDIPKYSTKLYETSKVTYFLEGEGVESFETCLARATAVLSEINSKYEGKTVLMVCHGDIGKMLLAAHRRVSWKEALDTPFIGNTDLLEL